MIPLLFIHINPADKISEILHTTNCFDGRLVTIITLFNEDKSNSVISNGIPVVLTSYNNLHFEMRKQLDLIRKQYSDAEFITIYEDREILAYDRVNQFTFSSEKHLNSFSILEDIESPVSPLRKKIMVQIVGNSLNDPEPLLWVIPKNALDLLSIEKDSFSYFPLSWLHLCKIKKIPIQITSAKDIGTDTIRKFKFNSFVLCIYALDVFIRYSFSAIVAMLVDNLVFWAVNKLGVSYLLSLVSGRIISTALNYFLLRTKVFKEKEKNYKSLFRYLLLVLFSGSIVWGTISYVSRKWSIEPVVIKMCIELLMFIFNYFMSKYFVFKSNSDSKMVEKK